MAPNNRFENLKREYHVDSEGGIAFVKFTKHDLEVIRQMDSKYTKPVISNSLDSIADGFESLYDNRGLRVGSRSLPRIEAILVEICKLARD